VSLLIRREPNAVPCRLIVKQVDVKGLPMRKPLAEEKTFPTLAAAVDHLKREFDELQQLREALAKAERSNLERDQRRRTEPLS
jgi:hypothetical protein